jgi:hypothetical protein
MKRWTSCNLNYGMKLVQAHTVVSGKQKEDDQLSIYDSDEVISNHQVSVTS